MGSDEICRPGESQMSWWPMRPAVRAGSVEDKPGRMGDVAIDCKAQSDGHV